MRLKLSTRQERGQFGHIQRVVVMSILNDDYTTILDYDCGLEEWNSYSQVDPEQLGTNMYFELNTSVLAQRRAGKQARLFSHAECERMAMCMHTRHYSYWLSREEREKAEAIEAGKWLGE